MALQHFTMRRDATANPQSTNPRQDSGAGEPRTMTWVVSSWPMSATWPPAGATPWKVSSALRTVSRDVFQNCAIATSRLAPGTTGSVMHVVDDVVIESACLDWVGRVCGRICVVCTRKSFGVAWRDAVSRNSAQEAPGGTCTKCRCSSPGWKFISPSCTVSLQSATRWTAPAYQVNCAADHGGRAPNPDTWTLTGSCRGADAGLWAGGHVSNAWRKTYGHVDCEPATAVRAAALLEQSAGMPTLPLSRQRILLVQLQQQEG